MKQIAQKHQQAEKLREEQEFLSALALYQEVINNYLQNRQTESVISPLQGMALTYKHLATQKDKKELLILAQNLAEASLNLAKKYELKTQEMIGWELMAGIYLEQGEFEQAEPYYLQALSLHEQDDALKGRYLYHLGSAQYQAGKKEEGKRNLEAGLELVKKGEGGYDQYTLQVWQTGALIELGKLLKNDEPEVAQGYLDEAEGIIETNPELKIRKEQTQELRKSFKTS